MQGTPTAADVGTYDNIVIRVGDGKTTASLPAFAVTVLAVASGSATLSWTPPTTNTDGSPLTNLAGYRVYWGPGAGNYTSSVTLNNPAAVASFEMARSWIGTIAPEGVTTYQEPDSLNVFIAGNAAFLRNWPYAWAASQDPASAIAGKVAWTRHTTGEEGLGVEFKTRDAGGTRRLKELVRRLELLEAENMHDADLDRDGIVSQMN